MKLLFCHALAVAVLSGAALPAATAAAADESRLQAAAGRLDSALSIALRAVQQDVYGAANIPPASAPAAWLRRASLDLAGRLPTSDELLAMNHAVTKEALGQAADRLLEEPGSDEMLFNLLAEAIALPKPALTKSPEIQPSLQLRQAVAEGLPYDRLVAKILCGEQPGEGGWLWQKQQGQPDILMRLACDFSTAFLGVRLSCAQCHNHPLADFTQRNALEFSACFVTPADRPMVFPRRYLYADAKPGQPVSPKPLPLSRGAGHMVEVTSPQTLGIWATQQEAARLAKVGALRLWDHLFGIPPARAGYAEGNVEKIARPPLAEQQCTVPAGREWWDSEDPRLDPKSAAQIFVNALGEEFRRCGWRQKEFLRILARTAAYQREASARRTAFLLGASPWVRRMQPAQSSQIISDMMKAEANAMPPREMADLAHALRVLGQGDGTWPDESRPVITHALTRFMAFSPDIETLATDCASLAQASTPENQVNQLFVHTLGRLPQQHEQKSALVHLASHPSQGACDIAWALLNTSEFLFQY